MRTSASVTARLLAAVAATVLLSGCGSGAGAPEGWRTLDAGDVRVSYPKGEGWTRLKGSDLGRDTAAVVLERDGADVAKIAVRKRFMRGGNPGVAAAGAMASLQPGARIAGGARLTIDGRDAETIEYTYRARAGTGAGNGTGGRARGNREITGGTLVRGVDVVTVDGDGKPLLVRVDAVEGALTDTQFKRVVNSVTFPDGH